MKELICIVCPKGCHLKVDEANDYKVYGNTCPRGEVYGKKELTNPTRVLTSTVRVVGGRQERVSVKTSCDVPKGLLPSIMNCLNDVELHAPLHRGMKVIEKVCDSDADILVTKDIEAYEE